MKRFFPNWRGLTQLFVITILPLTLLLLVIAFGGVNMHQQDMRALVGERDERAIQASVAALQSELHHRIATLSSMAVLSSGNLTFEEILASTSDLTEDFNGGIAILDSHRQVLANTSNDNLWNWVSQNSQRAALATSGAPGPVFSESIEGPNTGSSYVIVSVFAESRNVVVAGAFSPEMLAHSTLSTSYPDSTQVTIFLFDSARRVLYSSGPLASESLSPDHPGVAEVLRGESGTTYVKQNKVEHVIAYSPISLTGWALITEEEWEKVISPSLQLTQMAPLVIVPAFILALIAIWFGAKQIVQPLQKLESKAAALAWGDFDTIQDSVGGISEVQHLQKELTGMSRKVKAAQEGLRDYIGAITSAQEEERLRLARELHDDTIQSVIALKQRVQLAQKSVKDQTSRRTLGELESLAEQTVENLRRMTRALRPIYLEDLGLVTALEMLVRETNTNNPVKIGFKKTGDEQRLSHEVELALYRIAQEALSNVVRHSHAKRAELLIAFGDPETRLEVSDDGRGFDMPKSPTDFAPNGHFGLLGIRERADLIGARIEVETTPGKGTKLRVALSKSPS